MVIRKLAEQRAGESLVQPELMLQEGEGIAAQAGVSQCNAKPSSFLTLTESNMVLHNLEVQDIARSRASVFSDISISFCIAIAC